MAFMIKAGPLRNGGIIANYKCTAACRHCLYACSPDLHAGYVTKEKITEICSLLKKGRIGSVHIGGGEPFLEFPGLLSAVRSLAEAGIQLDYIETNAFWAANPERDEYITKLIDEGVQALCISVDPFHAEHVPWGLPLELADACEKSGMGYFLWKKEFVRPLSRLDKNKSHTREELETAVSPDYIGRTASAYGIRFGGRAVNIEEEYGSRKPAEALLDDIPCNDLVSTGHFHVDMDGCFIPPGCTGLRLPLEEALAGTKAGKYPVYETLCAGGIAALYELAGRRGFLPEGKGYTSKCNLCFRIRKFLTPMGYFELDGNFYAEAEKFYKKAGIK